MIQQLTYEELEQRIQELTKEALQRKPAEDALEESETRYRRLFETAQDGILILDADTELVEDTNPFILDMLGFSIEEMVGKRLWQIGPFRDIEASRSAFLELQKKEYIRSAEHNKLETTNPNIAFKFHLDSNLLNTKCSSSHIKKSLLNLVTNATEAIQDSGTVIISTTNRYLDKPLKGFTNVCQGEYAVLTIHDDGLGLSTEDLDRFFEPF